MKVAFDVDGTLRDYEDRIRHEIVDLLRWFLRNTKANVVVWSGGGLGRAESMVRALGLDNNPRVTAMAKNDQLKPDIAIDDQYVAFGKANINVCPISDDEADEIFSPAGGAVTE